jgi:hypothetical protein
LRDGQSHRDARKPTSWPQSPEKRTWKVSRDVAGSPAQGRSVGDGDIVVLEHPEFTAGQLVRFNGREAMVLSDDGPTVKLLYQSLRPGNLDRQVGRYSRARSIRVGEIDVPRQDLVAMNL